jgi:hypothetical protein
MVSIASRRKGPRREFQSALPLLLYPGFLAATCGSLFSQLQSPLDTPWYLLSTKGTFSSFCWRPFEKAKREPVTYAPNSPPPLLEGSVSSHREVLHVEDAGFWVTKWAEGRPGWLSPFRKLSGRIDCHRPVFPSLQVQHLGPQLEAS